MQTQARSSGESTFSQAPIPQRELQFSHLRCDDQKRCVLARVLKAMELKARDSRRYLSRTHRVTLATAAVLCLGGLAFAQTQVPGLTSLPSAEQIIQRSQDPFAGSVPQGKATPDVLELSVQDALDRGLKYNLGLYLSDRAIEQARAARLKALSDLLPNFNAAVTE